jgi:hypothetical protein
MEMTMFKKTVLTAATIAISLVAFQPAAQAGNIQIDVNFGGGHHGGHGGHGGHWGNGHGHGHGHNKLSCYTGKKKLRWNGYYNVRPYDCQGGRYGYRAIRNNRIYDVKMSAFTGRYSKRFIGFVY